MFYYEFYKVLWGVFKTESNICDEVFYENSERFNPLHPGVAFLYPLKTSM